eukprot:894183-Prymnesium_polylepis.2
MGSADLGASRGRASSGGSSCQYHIPVPLHVCSAAAADRRRGFDVFDAARPLLDIHVCPPDDNLRGVQRSMRKLRPRRNVRWRLPLLYLLRTCDPHLAAHFRRHQALCYRPCSQHVSGCASTCGALVDDRASRDREKDGDRETLHPPQAPFGSHAADASHSCVDCEVLRVPRAAATDICGAEVGTRNERQHGRAACSRPLSAHRVLCPVRSRGGSYPLDARALHMRACNPVRCKAQGYQRDAPHLGRNPRKTLLGYMLAQQQGTINQARGEASGCRVGDVRLFSSGSEAGRQQRLPCSGSEADKQQDPEFQVLVWQVPGGFGAQSIDDAAGIKKDARADEAKDCMGYFIANHVQ